METGWKLIENLVKKTTKNPSNLSPCKGLTKRLATLNPQKILAE